MRIPTLVIVATLTLVVLFTPPPSHPRPTSQPQTQYSLRYAFATPGEKATPPVIDPFSLREQVSAMFHHAYSGYLAHGFPADELKPLSCAPRGGGKGGKGGGRGTLDHAFAGFPLTLLDALDTLAVMGEWEEYVDGLWKFVDATPDFDSDVDVNVFELTIRGLGALVANHMLITAPPAPPDESHRTPPVVPKWAFESVEGGRVYDGELLQLAVDLADRLLPAFETPTGIPQSMAHLGTRRGGGGGGFSAHLPGETCTAGAGTLTLEFYVLSALTGDPKYRDAVEENMVSLFGLRSHLALFGNTFDVRTGRWTRTDASIGAGIDSFYEYLAKAHVLTGQSWYADMFEEAYAAVELYMRDGLFYRTVDASTGKHMRSTVSSLGAFWPALQTLTGDLDGAQASFEGFYSLWRRFGFLPEVASVSSSGSTSPVVPNYPLRPELVESAYYLYRATRDPYYLHVGAEMLDSIATTCKTRCGYAAVADVRDRRVEDRMDSFFLAETLKYLYLLFDVDDRSFVHNASAPSYPEGGYVFTTEAHVLPVSQRLRDVPTQVGENERVARTYAERLAWKHTSARHSRGPKQPRIHSSLSPHNVRDSPFPLGTCSADVWAAAASPFAISPYILVSRVEADALIGLSSPELEVHLDMARASHFMEGAAGDAGEGDGGGGGPHFSQSPRGPSAFEVGADTSTLHVFRRSKQVGRKRWKWVHTAYALSELSLGLTHNEDESAVYVSSINKIPYDADNMVLAMQTSEVPVGDGLGFTEDMGSVSLVVEGGEKGGIEYGGAPALFGPLVPGGSSGLSAPLVLASSLGCAPMEGAMAHKYGGKIVLVSRGSCNFVDKVAHFAAEGAAGVVVANHLESEGGETVFKMIGEGLPVNATVPSLMISRNAGNELRSRLRERERLVASMRVGQMSRGRVNDVGLLSYGGLPIENVFVFWRGVVVGDIPGLLYDYGNHERSE